MPSLNISSFKTSKVTNMEHMFRRCKIASLDLSGFDVTNVIDIRNHSSQNPKPIKNGNSRETDYRVSDEAFFYAIHLTKKHDIFPKLRGYLRTFHHMVEH